MNESNIRDLLRLYEEGKATEEQRLLVEAYLVYHRQQSLKREPDAKKSDDPLDEMMEKIRLAREREPKEVPVYSMEDADVYPAERVLEMPLYTPGRTGRQRRIAWMAAACVVLLLTAGLLWRQSPSSRQAGPEAITPISIAYRTVRAAPGKMVHLLFSDSSEVWLKAGSTLRYPQPFDNQMRKLELIDGEAFFQVHPDAKRGFIVQTDHLQTKVLGTSFNIKAYRESQQMSVTVTSGKVAVIPGTNLSDQGMTLLHDQEARYNIATGRLTSNTSASRRNRDWKDGTFNFTDESLGDIAIELEHYFNVHVGFKYPGIKKYRISASFRHTTPLKDMLAALCLLNQNHFIQTDAQHYVII